MQSEAVDLRMGLEDNPGDDDRLEAIKYGFLTDKIIKFIHELA